MRNEKMKGKIVYLADWQRNTIDQCEIITETETDFALKRARPQVSDVYSKREATFLCHKVCETYNDALQWIKERRLQQIQKITEQLNIANKKLSDVVKYYELDK